MHNTWKYTTNETFTFLLLMTYAFVSAYELYMYKSVSVYNSDYLYVESMYHSLIVYNNYGIHIV